MWIKPDDASTDQRGIVKSFQTTNGNIGDFYVYLGSVSGNDGLAISLKSTTSAEANGRAIWQSDLFDGTWQHLVIVKDSGNTNVCTDVTIYVDGVDQGAADTCGTSSSGWLTADEIGRIYTASSYFFDGDLDEMAFYDRELSTGDISALYNSGLGKNLVA